jgi:hypothetical protein
MPLSMPAALSVFFAFLHGTHTGSLSSRRTGALTSDVPHTAQLKHAA